MNSCNEISRREIAEGDNGRVYVATLTQDKSKGLHHLKLPRLIKSQDVDNRHKGTPTHVAIKTIPLLPGNESTGLKDVKHELTLLKGLTHPNVLAMDALYVDLVEDGLWIRMELMEGTLGGVIALVKNGLVLDVNMIARFSSDVSEYGSKTRLKRSRSFLR
jgi:p21-activated kinase 1